MTSPAISIRRVLLFVVTSFGCAAIAGAPADPDAAAKPYKAELERVYGLQKGQFIKHVARPFIPERMEWYRAENKTQAEAIPRGPDYMVFDWNEKTGLRNWAMGFGFQKLPLRVVLENGVRLKSYEFEGPADLLSLDMAGDWVVRPEADAGQKLTALARMVKQYHGRDVRFEQRELPREVIVAGGTWQFKPMAGTYNSKWVHLFAGEQDKDEGSGGGSGDLDEFLRMLGSRVGSKVVDEVEGDRPKMISWGHHQSSRLHHMPAGPERMEKVMQVLDVVSKQTGLTLELARRKVPVWVLIDVKPEV
jgi:hypothetical protein